jgi:hypothetical protein
VLFRSTKGSVKARQTEIKRDKDAADERKLLDAYADLIEQEAAAGKAVTDMYRGLKQRGGEIERSLVDKLAPDSLSSLVTGKKVSPLDAFRQKIGLGTLDEQRAANQADIVESRRLDAPLMDTKAGTIGNIAGKTAVAALVPGGGYLGAASTGALLGATEPTVGNESSAINTVAGVAGGLAGQFVGNRLSDLLRAVVANKASSLAAQQSQNSVRDATLAAAKDAGYVATPSQSGGALPLRVLEGISGKAKTEQLFGAHNQPITDALARQAVGLSKDAPLTSEAMQAIRQGAYQAGYEPVASVGQIATDSVYNKTLNGIMNKYQVKSFPGAKTPDIEALVQAHQVPTFDAGDALVRIQGLRDAASDAFRQGNTGLSKASKDIAKAMEDQIERNLMDAGKDGSTLLNNFRAARTLMAKAHTVEDAIKEGGGVVDASKIAARVQAGKKLTGELKTIGDFANNFKEVTRLPKSGDTNPITALDALFQVPAFHMTGGASLALPATRVAARYGLMSKPAQALMNPDYSIPLTLRALNSPSGAAMLNSLGPMGAIYGAQQQTGKP